MSWVYKENVWEFDTILYDNFVYAVVVSHKDGNDNYMRIFKDKDKAIEHSEELPDDYYKWVCKMNIE